MKTRTRRRQNAKAKPREGMKRANEHAGKKKKSQETAKRMKEIMDDTEREKERVQSRLLHQMVI